MRKATLPQSRKQRPAVWNLLALTYSNISYLETFLAGNTYIRQKFLFIQLVSLVTFSAKITLAIVSQEMKDQNSSALICAGSKRNVDSGVHVTVFLSFISCLTMAVLTLVEKVQLKSNKLDK